jgi:Uma2 family endonuclease
MISQLATPLPRLENGDYLTRREFERRYQATPRVKKAELIERTVYLMASPLHFESHAEPHAIIMTWLGSYWFATPGVRLGDNATVRLDADNEPQPDALLRLPEHAGGKSRLSKDDYIEGAPELVVEIAASSASYDLHQKRQVYRRNGVQEYIVWQVYEKRLDWWVLIDGEYVAVTPDSTGLLRSHTFPGLVLDVAALLKGSGATLLEKLHHALRTPEHQAFVKSLKVQSE